MFDNSKTIYEDTLKKSGFKNKLSCQQILFRIWMNIKKRRKEKEM